MANRAQEDDLRPPQPGFLSTATISWFSPVLRKGWKSPLQLQDLPPLLDPLQCHAAHKHLQAGLHELRQQPAAAGHQQLGSVELESLLGASNQASHVAAGVAPGTGAAAAAGAEPVGQKPQHWELRGAKGLVKLIWYLHRKGLLYGLLMMYAYQFLVFWQPMLLKGLINSLLAARDAPHVPPAVYAYACAMFTCPILGSLCKASAQLTMISLQIKLRSSLSAAVYAKCLRLSVSARQRLPSGRITNLMTTDVAKICDFLYPQLSFIAVAPVAIFFSLLLLWFQIGWAMLVGLVVLCIATPTSNWCVQKVQMWRKIGLKHSDTRVKLVGQFLAGVRVIKIYGWGDAAKSEINRAREGELGALRGVVPSRVAMATILYALPQLAGVLTFMVVGLVSPGSLSAGRLFASLVLFQILRFPLLSVSTGLVELGAAAISAQRITEFLNEEEQVEYVRREPLPGSSSEDASGGGGGVDKKETGYTATQLLHGRGAGILVQDATFAWPPGSRPDKQRGQQQQGRRRRTATATAGQVLGHIRRLGSSMSMRATTLVGTAPGWLAGGSFRLRTPGFMRSDSSLAYLPSEEAGGEAGGGSPRATRGPTIPQVPLSPLSPFHSRARSLRQAQVPDTQAINTAGVVTGTTARSTNGAIEVPLPSAPDSPAAPSLARPGADRASDAQVLVKGLGRDEDEEESEIDAKEVLTGQKQFTLRDVNLEVRPGELVAVVGRVGAGKSSLASALLGGMALVKGNVQVSGSVAYVAQTAWVLNGSVVENVTVARDPPASSSTGGAASANLTQRIDSSQSPALDEELWARCCHAACMSTDLRLLPAGRDTEIGEKGVNLSGGQKQRLSLARALYSDADVYVLDDPLSAVDVHVGRHIFKHAIQGMLKDKAVLLITNQVQYLPYATRIIVLSHGSIVISGTYAKCLASDRFAAMLQEFKAGDQQQVDEEDEEGAQASEPVPLSRAQQPPPPSPPQPPCPSPGPPSAGVEDTLQLGLCWEEPGGCTAVDTVCDTASVQPWATQVPSFDSGLSDCGSDSGLCFGTMPQPPAPPLPPGSAPPPPPTTPQALTSQSAAAAIAHAKAGKLVVVEDREKGQVSWQVYSTYLRAFTWTGCSCMLLWWAGEHGTRVITNVWLAAWSSAIVAGESDPAHMGGLTGGSSNRYAVGYLVLGLIYTLFVFLRSFTNQVCALGASQTIHAAMLNSLIRAPLSFFDATPAGRVLNRVSRDVEETDYNLPLYQMQLGNCVSRMVATVILLLSVQPPFIGVLIPLGVIYYFLQRYFRRSCIELQRLDAISRSPVYANFSETMSGLDTITAYQLQARFMERHEFKVDTNARAYLMARTADEWLSLRLDVIGATIVLSIALLNIIFRHRIGPELAALALSESIDLTTFLNYAVKVSALVESRYNAVERLRAYSHLPQEAPEEDPPAGSAAAARQASIGDGGVAKGQQVKAKPVDIEAVPLVDKRSGTSALSHTAVNGGSANSHVNSSEAASQLQPVHPSSSGGGVWPACGQLEFKELVLRYRPGLDPVLRGVSFTVQDGEKIGIVGRTGGGKSSLLVALFRLFEPESGSIILDGRDLLRLGLRSVRSAIACIPQEPVLFAGTVRFNLDPFQQHDDAALWEALELVQLKSYVAAMGGLSGGVAENGENFSVGQRQLVCVARALLRKPKVLAADEATASVDLETDALIQHTLRTSFASSTVLVIAHRLNTIMDTHKVLVMDAGQVAEFGPVPTLLAKEEGGLFRSMALSE